MKKEPDQKHNKKPSEEAKSSTTVTNIDYLEQLKIVQADFENYKKRVERDREHICKYANEELILKLLNVLDNIERALETDSDYDSLTCGIDLIYKQFKGLLEAEGLKEIKGKGEQFNPELHEAVLSEESTEDEDTILEELQKGYSLNDKLIRPSKVKVSGRKSNGGK